MKDTVKKIEIELDTSGTECPIPVLKARKLAQTINDGDIVKIIATDPLAEADLLNFDAEACVSQPTLDLFRDCSGVAYEL